MAFTHTRLCDLYEFTLRLKFGNILGATIAHASLQATDKLGYNLGYRTGVGHTSFYALGNQLFTFRWVVAVPATQCHGIQRSHSSVYLVSATLL